MDRGIATAGVLLILLGASVIVAGVLVAFVWGEQPHDELTGGVVGAAGIVMAVFGIQTLTSEYQRKVRRR